MRAWHNAQYCLVDGGLLRGQPASDGSAWQEYVLTDRGYALFPLIVALRQFGVNQQREDVCPDRTHVKKYLNRYAYNAIG